MYILMADDDKDDFLILKQAAEKTGNTFNISYAANWMDLWRHLIKQQPDILFLDLNMPVKDGFECLETLRADKNFKTLSIVIYSTSLAKTDIDKAYQKGANYFIVKPNSIEDITSILIKLSSMSKEALEQIPSREEFVII
jgi:CheY-like chemotaxis protein